MPSRKRARERAGNQGNLVGDERAAETLRDEAPVVVTDEDLVRLEKGCRWLFPYVNYIYSVAGHQGEPMPKRTTESVFWRKKPGTDSVVVGQAGKMIKQSTLWSPEDKERHLNDGFRFQVIREPFCELGGSEVLDLTFNGDGIVIGGVYNFYSRHQAIDRPAPNGHFNNIQQAHEGATVSGRAGLLIADFRAFATGQNAQLENIWNKGLSPIPPAHLL